MKIKIKRDYKINNKVKHLHKNTIFNVLLTFHSKRGISLCCHKQFHSSENEWLHCCSIFWLLFISCNCCFLAASENKFGVDWNQNNMKRCVLLCSYNGTIIIKPQSTSQLTLRWICFLSLIIHRAARKAIINLRRASGNPQSHKHRKKIN